MRLTQVCPSKKLWYRDCPQLRNEGAEDVARPGFGRRSRDRHDARPAGEAGPKHWRLI